MQFTEPSIARTTSASKPRGTRRYTIALKAWIPHEHVANPATQIIISEPQKWINKVSRLASPLGGSIETTSVFKGDNHRGYGGSYRALAIVSFNWDGNQTSGFESHFRGGTSHMQVELKVTVGVSIPFADDLEKTLKTFKHEWSKKASNSGSIDILSSNSFSFNLSSANPFLPGVTIDADATVSIFEDHIRVKGTTDAFPSHGLLLRESGHPSRSRVIFDASSINASGILGVANLTTGLALKRKKYSQTWTIEPA